MVILIINKKDLTLNFMAANFSGFLGALLKGGFHPRRIIKKYLYYLY